jgi:predicted Ser/Thr protein kinase
LAESQALRFVGRPVISCQHCAVSWFRRARTRRNYNVRRKRAQFLLKLVTACFLFQIEILFRRLQPPTLEELEHAIQEKIMASHPQPVLSVLSMEVDHDNDVDSEYRLEIGTRVRYLKIAPNTFDSDTLSFPLASLPTIPYDLNWTVARIHRNSSGELKVGFSFQKLAGVRNVWNEVQINVLDLERIKQITGATFEATCSCFSTVPVIAKIARFEWQIPRIERETRAYQILHQTNVAIAPRFLGHIHEEGRVIGFLMEKLNGRHASFGDLEKCEATLQNFHDLGLIHGDANRYNFLVTRERVMLIDFERFEETSTGSVEAKAQELLSLKSELKDESGRGAGFIFSEDG